MDMVILGLSIPGLLVGCGAGLGIGLISYVIGVHQAYQRGWDDGFTLAKESAERFAKIGGLDLIGRKEERDAG